MARFSTTFGSPHCELLNMLIVGSTDFPDPLSSRYDDGLPYVIQGKILLLGYSSAE
jgi:hypothetical protein